MRRPSWPIWIYRIEGESMAPTYNPGATLLGLRWFRPRSGQVVVAAHGGRLLVKRLVKLDEQGAWLEGDNPGRSTDSRHFGAISPKELQARIIARLD